MLEVGFLPCCPIITESVQFMTFVFILAVKMMIHSLGKINEHLHPNRPLAMYLHPHLAYSVPLAPYPSNEASLHVFVFEDLNMGYKCNAVKAFTECKPSRFCTFPTHPPVSLSI